MLKRAIDVLERFLFFVAGAGLVASIALAFAAVILRYIFNYSLEWIEEGARYLALAAAFVIAGPVLRNGGHVALDLLTSGLEGARLQMHRLAVNVAALLVGLAVFVWGSLLVRQTYEFGLLTGSLQFPQWLPYSIVPVGMAILVLFSAFEITDAFRALRSGKEASRHDEPSGEPVELAGNE